MIQKTIVKKGILDGKLGTQLVHALTDQNIRDNEKPPRSIIVPAFQASGRAITNEEVS